MKKSWAIQQDSFEKLLTWLDQDREAAGIKYESIRTRLIKILNYRGCFEAEDVADKTFDRVIRKIDFLTESYEGDPVYYFLGVANNVYREFLKEAKSEELPAEIPQKEAESGEDDQPEYDCLEKCLEKLPSDNRRIIVEYYKDERSAKIDNRKKLAEETGISMGALHVKIFRMRTGLQKCVLKCVEGKKDERFS